jgi:pyruvate formate lyase activating enzyme
MTELTLPIINLALCTRCNECVTHCPENALAMAKEGPVFNLPITCTYCQDCEGLCPTAAIRAPLRMTWSH